MSVKKTQSKRYSNGIVMTLMAVSPPPLGPGFVAADLARACCMEVDQQATGNLTQSRTFRLLDKDSNVVATKTLSS